MSRSGLKGCANPGTPPKRLELTATVWCLYVDTAPWSEYGNTMSSISKRSAVRQTGIASLRATLLSPIQFLGFWVAVVAPFVFLGLVVTGVAVRFPLAMLGVLASNVVGLVLGSGYNR